MDQITPQVRVLLELVDEARVTKHIEKTVQKEFLRQLYRGFCREIYVNLGAPPRIRRRIQRAKYYH